jgi:aspartyl-tRNA(Asn)/glutamyl-tRNA(Gln) amidotransferase subunit A
VRRCGRSKFRTSQKHSRRSGSFWPSPERFGDEIGERLRDAEHLKAHRYAKAQHVTKRRSLKEVSRVLEEVDVLLTPTVPIAATEIGQREVNIDDHEELVFSALTRFTGPTNLNGLPSLSVPCGLTRAGLPVGLQIIGRPFDEATVYRYGHAYEMAASTELRAQ